MTLMATSTTNTAPAQSLGLVYHGPASSVGIFVSPKTRSLSSASGLGFVPRLTRMVTARQTMRGQEPREMGTAHAWASAAWAPLVGRVRFEKKASNFLATWA